MVGSRVHVCALFLTCVTGDQCGCETKGNIFKKNPGVRVVFTSQATLTRIFYSVEGAELIAWAGSRVR